MNASERHVGSRKQHQSEWTASPAAPILSPSSLRSHLPLRTVLCTAARQPFYSVNLIIALSCLKCSRGFPRPLDSSPNFLRLPNLLYRSSPICISELASCHWPLAPGSSYGALLPLCPLILHSLLPLWEDAPGRRSSNDCPFSLFPVSVPAPVPITSCPFVIVIALLDI